MRTKNNAVNKLIYFIFTLLLFVKLVPNLYNSGSGYVIKISGYCKRVVIILKGSWIAVCSNIYSQKDEI